LYSPEAGRASTMGRTLPVVLASSRTWVAGQPVCILLIRHCLGEAGWVSERFKELVLKTSVRGTVPWVRIPPHPPSRILSHSYFFLRALIFRAFCCFCCLVCSHFVSCKRTVLWATCVQDSSAYAVQIDGGEMPDGLSRKTVTARQNGGTGGRPRKGESADQARARRAREMEQQQAQQHMPLVSSVRGGMAENRDKKPTGFSVAGNIVSPVFIDLESERDNIPSISGETENQKPELDDALVRKVAARVLSVSGMSDQASYAVSLSRGWLGMGLPRQLLSLPFRSIRQQSAPMARNHAG
jgi:hypothetical protein